MKLNKHDTPITAPRPASATSRPHCGTGPALLLRTLLLLVMLTGALPSATLHAQTDQMVVPAGEIDLTGRTGYWIRNTAGSQLNLSTQLPTGGTSGTSGGDAGWLATWVSVQTASLSDLTQVFYFMQEGNKIYMYTQNAEKTEKTYIGAKGWGSNQTWAMGTITLSGGQQHRQHPILLCPLRQQRHGASGQPRPAGVVHRPPLAGHLLAYEGVHLRRGQQRRQTDCRITGTTIAARVWE